MRFENLPQVGHPEPLVPPGAEGRPDGVLKNLLDTEEGENAGLEVGHPHLAGRRSPLIRHHNVFLLNLSAGLRNYFRHF